MSNASSPVANIRSSRTRSVVRKVLGAVVGRFKGFLKEIYFEYGVLYPAGALAVSLFVLIAIFRAIAVPLFGALQSPQLANPATLVATLGVVVGVACQTTREIKQRERGEAISEQPTPDAADDAVELLDSRDHLARQHGARVLASLVDDGAGVIVKRSDRSPTAVIGLVLDTLYIEERDQSTLHRDLATTLSYFSRDYPEETLAHKRKLIAALRHDNPTVQRHTATAVGNVVTGHPDESDDFIEPLTELADDDDPQIRISVCYALSRISHRRAPELLNELADDPHPGVHEAATDMLSAQQASSGSEASSRADAAGDTADTTDAGDNADAAEAEDTEGAKQVEDTEFVNSPPDMDLDDVAAMNDLKDRLHEHVITPFEGGGSYEKYDVSSVSGILFHGPPGTGKTYISQCLAGELGINYADISVADIDSSIIGEGVENLDRVFTEARQTQPSLVFIDELDALGSERSAQNTHNERKRQVNQLLEELSDVDGDDDMLVVAATNNPSDVDDALLRTGRFDSKITIPKPEGMARLTILAHHLPTPVEDADVDEIIQATRGFVASDLEEVANQAARQAAYRERETGTEGEITGQDVMEAVNTVGDERGSVTDHVGQPPAMDFDDVAGMDDLKETLRETIIKPLENPELYEEYGIGVERGFILHGPPGTGKTYITKCLAGELGISYIEATAGDLVSKWIGEGAENIQQMFEEARANQPCLIFIDEIDALATDRSLGNQQKSERQMVNQFLEELSASHDADENVIMIGATNRLEAVDSAILRTGRLGKAIEVPPPDAAARIGILKQHLDAPTEAIDEEHIRTLTEGLVSSDMEQIADTAARRALHRTHESEDKSAVTQDDIETVATDLQPEKQQ
jgi:transitional endoplasmic reticulum ATPase